MPPRRSRRRWHRSRPVRRRPPRATPSRARTPETTTRARSDRSPQGQPRARPPVRDRTRGAGASVEGGMRGSAGAVEGGGACRGTLSCERRADLRDEGGTVSVAKCWNWQRWRRADPADRLEMVYHPFAMAIGDGTAEENQVRYLAIDRDDRRVGGCHQHEFRADIVADDFAQCFGFGRLRFDSEDPAHVSSPVAGTTESQLMCHDCRGNPESYKFRFRLMFAEAIHRERRARPVGELTTLTYG